MHHDQHSDNWGSHLGFDVNYRVKMQMIKIEPVKKWGVVIGKMTTYTNHECPGGPEIGRIMNLGKRDDVSFKPKYCSALIYQG